MHCTSSVRLSHARRVAGGTTVAGRLAGAVEPGLATWRSPVYLATSSTEWGALISIFWIPILSVSATNYPYPYIFTNRYPYPIRIRYDSFSCIQSTGMIEANWMWNDSHWWGGQLQDAHANLAQTCADQSRASAVDRHIQRLIWSTYTNNFY